MNADTMLARLAADRARVDRCLEGLFEQRHVVEPRLEAAMRHGLLVGGKRLRPILVYAAGRALGADDD